MREGRARARERREARAKGTLGASATRSPLLACTHPVVAHGRIVPLLTTAYVLNARNIRFTTPPSCCPDPFLSGVDFRAGDYLLFDGRRPTPPLRSRLVLLLLKPLMHLFRHQQAPTTHTTLQQPESQTKPRYRIYSVVFLALRTATVPSRKLRARAERTGESAAGTADQDRTRRAAYPFLKRLLTSLR